MKHYYLFILVCLCGLNASAQVDSASWDVYSLERQPLFSIFRDNYFTTGTTLGQKATPDNSDAKFQISVQQRMGHIRWLSDSYVYFTYTQKSFWDIYKSSYPFRDSNYNPGLGLRKNFYRDRRISGYVAAGFEHESNGQEDERDRSWNRYFFVYGWQWSGHFQSSVRLYIPEGVSSSNAELIDYVGYAEYSTHWVNHHRRTLVIDVTARKGRRWDWRGNLQVDVRWRRPNWSQFLFA